MSLYREIRKALKKNQFVYFWKIRLFDKDYRQNKKDMMYSTVKSREQIKREMQLIEQYWHCKSLHYVRYRLFEKDLTDDELLDYIPPYYHYNFYNPPLYNGLDVKKYDDKYQLDKLFRERDVATPRVVARYFNESLLNLDGAIIDISSLFLQLNENEKIFIKPVDGAGGTGIVVLKKQGDGFYLKDSRVVDLSSVLDKSREYILQLGIKQRKDISQINASSVNTLRVVTQWRDGLPCISVCVMRIGRNNSDVDNSHQGGLSVQIDVETGKMYKSATAEHGGGLYYAHPDSGFIFDDFVIAEWEQICKDILVAAEKFKEIPEIAWDVAISDAGVVFIELNLGYGLTHLQCCCGGMRRKLGVYPKR